MGLDGMVFISGYVIEGEIDGWDGLVVVVVMVGFRLWFLFVGGYDIWKVCGIGDLYTVV